MPLTTHLRQFKLCSGVETVAVRLVHVNIPFKPLIRSDNRGCFNATGAATIVGVSAVRPGVCKLHVGRQTPLKWLQYLQCFWQFSYPNVLQCVQLLQQNDPADAAFVSSDRKLIGEDGQGCQIGLTPPTT